jgi:predicted metal-dependent hydrolase
VRSVRIRAPRFVFDAVPRGWVATDPAASDLVDAISLVFPEGERFFIRSVVAYAEVWKDDPDLAARVREFVGQEGRHGLEHDRMNRALGARGHDTERFDDLYEQIMFRTLEPRIPPHIRLAMTAALEHLTATLAELVLGTDLLADAHPEIQRLLRWHAVEEIEHRAVAFDVLNRVDPRLRTRLAGTGAGLVALFGFWGLAFVLLRQEDRETARPSDTVASRRFWGEAARAVPRVGRAMLRYTKRDFHPDEVHRDPVLGERVDQGFRAMLGVLATA